MSTDPNGRRALTDEDWENRRVIQPDAVWRCVQSDQMTVELHTRLLCGDPALRGHFQRRTGDDSDGHDNDDDGDDDALGHGIAASEVQATAAATVAATAAATAALEAAREAHLATARNARTATAAVVAAAETVAADARAVSGAVLQAQYPVCLYGAGDFCQCRSGALCAALPRPWPIRRRLRRQRRQGVWWRSTRNGSGAVRPQHWRGRCIWP